MRFLVMTQRFADLQRLQKQKNFMLNIMQFTESLYIFDQFDRQNVQYIAHTLL